VNKLRVLFAMRELTIPPVYQARVWSLKGSNSVRGPWRFISYPT